MSAILLNCAKPGDLEQINLCFYTVFFQIFSILVATFASFLRSQLSSSDSLFALGLILSPTTMHLFWLAPVKPSQWFKRPINANTVYLILTLCLFVTVSTIAIVRLVDSGCYVGARFANLGQNPYITVPALLCLVLHVFQIPRSYIVRCLVQLWFLPMRPYGLIVAFGVTLPLSLQMVGVWTVPGVRDEWRDRNSALSSRCKSLTLLIPRYRSASESSYGSHGARAVPCRCDPGNFAQCRVLGPSNELYPLFECSNRSEYFYPWYDSKSIGDSERMY